MPTATAPTKVAGDARTAVKVCDVIILGSGLAGWIAGAVLARHGADVVLVDAGSHPRFAIGESMTPGAADWMNIIAERYGVPEVKSLATVKANSRGIGPVFGLKAHFGFMFHYPVEEPDPRECTQLALPATFRKQGHLYRQDTDSFMFHVAVRYGCTPRQNWRAVDVEVDGDG
jgi:tetracycline 7-halogenase / FADH2 O2-dependent halogenase